MAKVSNMDMVVAFARGVYEHRGDPNEEAYLDDACMDFVHEVAKGRLEGAEATAVALMLDIRRDQMQREAEEAAEEEERRRPPMFGDDGTAYAGKFL